MDLHSNSEDDGEREAEAMDVAESSDAAVAPRHGGATSSCQTQAPIVKLTRRNDNFYEDCCNKGFDHRSPSKHVRNFISTHFPPPPSPPKCVPSLQEKDKFHKDSPKYLRRLINVS